MRTERMAKFAQGLTAIAVAAVLVFGASEVLAAQGTHRSSACEEGTNWCAGPNGDDNCNDCCKSGLDLGGLCVGYEPGPDQGCICYG